MPPLSRRAFSQYMTVVPWLAGCNQAPTGVFPSKTIPLESLLRQIKYDVGTYIFQHQDDSMQHLRGRACAGQVEFAIRSLKISVTTSIDRTQSASAGLQVPIDVVTLDAGGSGSRLLNDTITTTLVIWPITAPSNSLLDDETEAQQRLTAVPPPSPDFSGTPISDALNQLRNDLIQTSDTPPCFDFGREEQDDNVVKWAFSVSDKMQGTAKLSLLLFSVGAEASATTTFANTIEATFIAFGEGFG